MNETLGQFIDRIRDGKDLSLRELAKRIGCTAPFLSDVIHARRYPSDNMMKEIARALEVKESELRERDHRPPIDDIKRRSLADPQLAIAFRTVIDKNVSGHELLEWLDTRRTGKQQKR